MDAAEIAGQVVRYVVPVLGAYGERVLTRIEESGADQAGDAVVSFGGRLLRRILRRDQSRAAVEEAVMDLAVSPDDGDAAVVLRRQVAKALAADPDLAADIQGLLAGAPAGSAGEVNQQVLGFDCAQQAVQGHGVQTVTFGQSPKFPA